MKRTLALTSLFTLALTGGWTLEPAYAAASEPSSGSSGSVSRTANTAATGRVTGPQPAEPEDALDARVASIVEAEILAKGVPSASVAVMRDGKMLLERAWGVADIEKNAAASSSTTYPIGSLTKQFTAALVLEQVDRGRLALADPVGKHLAGLRPEVAAITIEQLLNHTSGLKRSIIDRENRFETMSVEALLAQAVRDDLQTAPGAKFAYSNSGYTVLGALVEKLYGKSYATALQDEIATPLQLTSLSGCAEPKPGEATGYSRTPGGETVPPPGVHHSQYLGAGGICATAADLVRWTHALHNGRVLTPESYQAMITPRGAARESNYGFGLSVSPAQWGQPAVHHGGQSVTGHTAELRWYPQDSLAVALVYNNFPRVSGVADLVSRIVLGVPLPEAEPAAPDTAAPSTPEKPAERGTLAGVYGTSSRRAFEVTLENGELFMIRGGVEKEPLVFRSGNTYALGTPDSTTTVTFIIENGAVKGFEANANGSKRIVKRIE